jgi:GT2 family glycosyltransferase
VSALFATFIVPTFNRASFIAECLRSIQAQTEGEWSIVVVDDASTDDTGTVVAGLAVPGLRYLRNQSNGGASTSRNRGIELAEDGLVVFIDSDDRLHPDHLRRVREVFSQRPQAGIVCCDSRIIDAAGTPRPDGRTFQQVQADIKGRTIVSGPRSLADVFSFSTSFPGTAIRRDVARRMGGFDQGLFPLDDVDLQLRAAAAGIEVYYLHEALADYRTHAGSESAGAGRAVATCLKKVECLERWAPAVARAAGRGVARRKLADARLELALASWKAGRPAAAAAAGARSLWLSPGVPLGFARRRLGGTREGAARG